MPRPASIWFREQTGWYAATLNGTQYEPAKTEAEDRKAFYELIAKDTSASAPLCPHYMAAGPHYTRYSREAALEPRSYGEATATAERQGENWPTARATLRRLTARDAGEGIAEGRNGGCGSEEWMGAG